MTFSASLRLQVVIRSADGAFLGRGDVDLLRFTSADLATPGRVGRTVRAALLTSRERHESRSRTA